MSSSPTTPGCRPTSRTGSSLRSTAARGAPARRPDPRLIDAPAAVDEQGLAGDIARRVAREEDDHPVELVDARRPLQRGVPDDPCDLVGVLEKAVEPGGE